MGLGTGHSLNSSKIVQLKLPLKILLQTLELP